MSVDLGDVVRLLSVAVAELADITRVGQVNQLSTELLEPELSGEVNQRGQLKFFVHCIALTLTENRAFRSSVRPIAQSVSQSINQNCHGSKMTLRLIYKSTLE